MFDLPVSVEVDGKEYAIRSDFRAALDICVALNDPELSHEEKLITALVIFYSDFDSLPINSYEEAIKKCFWFINGGDQYSETTNKHNLVDWKKDFAYIVAPINRVTGQDVRQIKYYHWWSFLAAYMEIGECTFSQIVRIRDLQARHKPLDKADREWYKRNKNLVDIKRTYSEEENNMLRLWSGGG